MSLVAHIEDGGLSRLLLQVVGAEVDAVVVTVGAAMGDQSPSVVVIKVVKRCEKLDDLAFEHLRRHLPGRVGKWVSSIIQVHQVDAGGIVPLVEIAQWRDLVKGVAEILGECLAPDRHPFVQLGKARAGVFPFFFKLFHIFCVIIRFGA